MENSIKILIKYLNDEWLKLESEIGEKVSRGEYRDAYILQKKSDYIKDCTMEAQLMLEMIKL